VCTLRKAVGSVCISGGFVCMALIALSKGNASEENCAKRLSLSDLMKKRLFER
jgi:hypothetical protein